MKGFGKLLFFAGIGAAAGAGLYYAKKFIEETDAEQVMEGPNDDYDIIDENGEPEVDEEREYVNIPIEDANAKLDEAVESAVDEEVETEDLIAEDEEEA